MGWDFSLSPSKIGVMNNCTRCFYDANKLKIEQPRGIFPSLPGGVDRVMKEVMDAARPAWPPTLIDEMKGKSLWGTVYSINKLRNWRSGLKAVLSIKGKSVSLIGALDDLIVESDGTYSPYDTKTKGDEPKYDGAKYYQHQLDLYALLLRENAMMPSGKGYLNYWYPVSLQGNTMEWAHKLYTLMADPIRGMECLENAVTILTGAQPEPNPSCEHCRFAQARVDAALKVISQPATQQVLEQV